MAMTKRIKPMAPGLALPQHLVETIMCYLDTATAFFSALRTLPRAGKSPFLVALEELTAEVPPWMLWPILDVGCAAEASIGHEALFARVLQSHPYVLMNDGEPEKYLPLVSPSADVVLPDYNNSVATLAPSSLARVTNFQINLVSLRTVATYVAHAPRLRAMSLTGTLNALTDDESALDHLFACTKATLRRMELILYCDSIQRRHAAIEALAHVLATFPVETLYIHNLSVSVTEAKMLYDAMRASPRLQRLYFIASAQLARYVTAWATPQTCLRYHAHDAACVVSTKSALSSVTTWTIDGEWSEIKAAVLTLRTMQHVRELHVMVLPGPVHPTEYKKLLEVIEALPLRKLSLLGFECLTTPAIKELMACLRRQGTLRSLHLIQSSLSADALATLAATVPMLGHIKHMDLSDNDFSDDQVPSLQVLLSHLAHLNLHGTKLSSSATERLKRYALDVLCHLSIDNGDINEEY
ncbi:hypothetical protein SDRG_10580 [Saprolegnia diclina VS20]|uniref:Uncharacterized protein n=1 Tax=Saprolegnia diclina (strain VS20) TaxID=1156394 RepID=T0QAT6_SAPDV|nr:hypothetical protein SDRG_10580 [Saprolegnia diclina VS20]EQC31791.1 hypothetical protein SDRG_10580 [Saprolegnia diclina VS20]|eukprot:XP_008614798.1 hypothetical protein SDRG_10580 [Saprolegnia diclina VS20]